MGSHDLSYLYWYLSGIPFSAMKSGAWRIVVEGSQIAVQRTINLNVGNPSVVIVTVCRSRIPSHYAGVCVSHLLTPSRPLQPSFLA